MKPAKLQSVTMAILITVTLFLCPTGSMAQTSVSGTINGKTWTPANSPYLVTGDINVVNLEIEPGVTVLFDGDYVFGVTGILKAVGTAQDSIVFTITDSVAGWRGISFNSVSSRFDLAYCKIEFATNSGIRLETSIVTMKNCTISNNSSDNGGGVYISGSSIAILRNCTIINNVATSGGGIYISFDGAATLINCIIAYNVASTSGGGIFNQGEATVTNCVVVYNSNNGIRRESGAVTVKNSIIFFNSSAQITPEFNINVPVKYCDVQGGFSGTGNINLYPIFVDNELLALPDFSPCVDAGDPDSSYFDICFPPSLGNERNDMGAYGGPEACGWLSSVPDTTADNSVLISIVDTTAAPTDTLNIPISFENGMGIAGAEISITFDSTLLTAFGAQTTSLTNNFTLTDSVSSGKIALTMASNDAITANSGDLVILSFRVNANAMQGDATTLTFEELTVFDDGSNEIPATAVNGLFTVCCEPGTGLTLMITPDSAIVAQGDTLTFMAAGLDSMNNPVAVNPSWTAACGIFQPNTGATVVFTADTEAFGECLIIAQQADASDTVRVFIGVRGDINADTTVNVGDAIICLKIIAGDTLPPNPPGHLTPTAFEQWTADVNQDDAINSADALLILYTALDRLFPKTNIIANEDDAVIKIPCGCSASFECRRDRHHSHRHRTPHRCLCRRFNRVIRSRRVNLTGNRSRNCPFLHERKRPRNRHNQIRHDQYRGSRELTRRARQHEIPESEEMSPAGFNLNWITSISLTRRPKPSAHKCRQAQPMLRCLKFISSNKITRIHSIPKQPFVFNCRKMGKSA